MRLPGSWGPRAQYRLRQVFVFLHGHVMNKPEQMTPAATPAFDSESNLTDKPMRQQQGDVVATVVAWTEQIKK